MTPGEWAEVLIAGRRAIPPSGTPAQVADSVLLGMIQAVRDIDRAGLRRAVPGPDPDVQLMRELRSLEDTDPMFEIPAVPWDQDGYER